MNPPHDVPLCIGPESPRWPGRFEEASPAPERIWLRGRTELLKPGPTVAIVGSRAATPYGLEQARRFSSELARAGVCIVSGLARGIDAAAHTGALDAGGSSIAVLGSGVDRPWPAVPLAERMAREGLLLSEYPLGQGPRRHHFPLRNRLIAALCDGLLVVEAAHASGSLISAHWASDMGRDVFALPGRVDQPLANGTLRLIREGAQPVGSPADLLADLFGREIKESPDPQPICSDPVAQSLLDALRGETLGAEELAQRTQHDLGAVLASLVELELDGRLHRAPGGLYQHRL